MSVTNKLATAALAGLLTASVMTAGAAFAAEEKASCKGAEKAAEKSSCTGKEGAAETEKGAK